MFDYAKLPLSQCGFSFPVDFILAIFPSYEDFGLSVLSRIFTKDSQLTPDALRVFRFVSRCSNPDPVYWGIYLLRHFSVVTMLDAVNGGPAIVEPRPKPLPSKAVLP